jgi:hypothetical protein
MSESFPVPASDFALTYLTLARNGPLQFTCKFFVSTERITLDAPYSWIPSLRVFDATSYSCTCRERGCESDIHPAMGRRRVRQRQQAIQQTCQCLCPELELAWEITESGVLCSLRVHIPACDICGAVFSDSPPDKVRYRDLLAHIELTCT